MLVKDNAVLNWSTGNVLKSCRFGSANVESVLSVSRWELIVKRLYFQVSGHCRVEWRRQTDRPLRYRSDDIVTLS